jgi:hypothetical protein
MLRSSKWSLSFRYSSQNPTCISLLLHTSHMPHPSHPPWLYDPNNIWWGGQMMKLLTVQLNFITTSIKTHQWIFFWWSVFKLPVNEKQIVKGKVQFSLSMPWRHTAGVEVLLHPFLTLALDGGEWSTSHPVHLTLWKQPWYALNERLGESRNQSGRFGEQIHLLSLAGFEHRTVLPVD